jgi:hypothetical protein
MLFRRRKIELEVCVIVLDHGGEILESAVVIVPRPGGAVSVRLVVCPQPLERCRAIAAVGERDDWKSSMPISFAVCVFHPGSVKRGGT